MKLCLVTPCPPRYLALGNYAAALLPALAGMAGVRELVVLGDFQAELEPRCNNIRIVRAWDANSPRALPQILAALKAEQPDLVWYNAGMLLGRGPLSNIARICASSAGRRLGIPSVVTLHNMVAAAPLKDLRVGTSPLHHIAGYLATRMLFKADLVCLTLQRYVELARTHYRAENTVHIPHHGFGQPRGRRVAPRGTRVLAFGTLAPFKGIDVLLRAFGTAAEQLPDLRLVVAGGEHPRFPDYAVSAEGSGQIRCFGALTDQQVNALVQWSDVVVIPSMVATGASSVMHRAAAAGKSIIASDLQDFRAAVDEQGFAVCFAPPGDANTLAQAITEVALNQEYRSWASATNLIAAERVTPERIASRYMTVFNFLLSQQAAAEFELRPSPPPVAAPQWRSIR